MASVISAIGGRPVSQPLPCTGVPEIEYPSPLSALPSEPQPFVVKNTFIDPASCQPSSLLGSTTGATRAIRSWGPGSRCGGLGGFESNCYENEEPSTSRSLSTSASDSTITSVADEGSPSLTQGPQCSHASTPRDGSTSPMQALPQIHYPTPEFSVRNTFIDTCSGGRLPSMVDDAFQERKVVSCPGSRLLGDSAEAESDLERSLPVAMIEPSSGDDEDDFTPFPIFSQIDQEDQDVFVPAPPAFASIDMMEAIAPEYFLPGMWAPLSFVPPAPCQPTMTSAMPNEGESDMASPVAAILSDASSPTIMAMVPVMTAPPLLGSPDCPTIGSQLHYLGTCKPCAHAFTKGCNNGLECQFCHVCAPGELKRRQKERRVQLARQQALERRAEGGGSAKGRRAGGQRA